MKKSIECLVHDWNPNGTNDVTFVFKDEVIGTLDEVTFGIDINKFAIEYISETDCAALVPLHYVLSKLAVSPMRTSEQARERVRSFIEEAVRS